MDFFNLLIAITFIAFVIWMMIVIQYLKYLKELIEYAVLESEDQDEEDLINESQESKIKQEDVPTIVWKSSDIACVYQDKTAYKYLKSEDNRLFVFESIAIEQSEGKYYADDSNGFYLIIDKCFLYREINQSEINTFNQQ